MTENVRRTAGAGVDGGADLALPDSIAVADVHGAAGFLRD